MQKSPSAHNHTTLLGYIFATTACIGNRKKIVKQQYLLHMFSQYGEFQPSNGWDQLASLGHRSKFQRVSTSWLRDCTDVAQRTSTKLCRMFGRLLGWYTTYIFGGSCPLTEFCKVHPSLAFSYIGSITARHSSSERQPNFAPFTAWYKEWNYGTFAPRHFQQRAPSIFWRGHHVGHRPTF